MERGTSGGERATYSAFAGQSSGVDGGKGNGAEEKSHTGLGSKQDNSGDDEDEDGYGRKQLEAGEGEDELDLAPIVEAKGKLAGLREPAVVKWCTGPTLPLNEDERTFEQIQQEELDESALIRFYHGSRRVDCVASFAWDSEGVKQGRQNTRYAQHSSAYWTTSGGG